MVSHGGEVDGRRFLSEKTCRRVDRVIVFSVGSADASVSKYLPLLIGLILLCASTGQVSKEVDFPACIELGEG